MVVSAPTSIEIHAPADRVWRTLVEPDLVGRYVDGTQVDTDWAVWSRIARRGEWQGRSCEDMGEVGSSPGQGAADGMIASAWQPVAQGIKRVARADDGG